MPSRTRAAAARGGITRSPAVAPPWSATAAQAAATPPPRTAPRRARRAPAAHRPAASTTANPLSAIATRSASDRFNRPGTRAAALAPTPAAAARTAAVLGDVTAGPATT